MRVLFWRYFLTFWAAIAALAAASIILTGIVASQRFQSLQELDPVSLTDQARQIAQEGGRPALEDWLRNMAAQHVALSIYLVEDTTTWRDILGRSIHPRVVDSLKTSPRMKQWPDLPAGQAPEASVGQPRPASWWGPRPIRLADGQVLALIFLPFDNSQWDMLGVSFIPYTLLLAALLVTMSLSWLMARHVTGPIRQLKQLTRELAAGQLHARAAPALARRRDALGQLAHDFNAMAARIQKQVVSRELLLRDVAHELRSPLARLQLAVELAQDQDERFAAPLERVAREGRRLDDIIRHTLELARLRDFTPASTEVDLGELCSVVVEDARFEGRQRKSGILWQAPDDPVLVLGERHSLHSAIENVLRNALRHSDPDSPIELRLYRQGGHAVIEVQDGGPGVDEPDLDRLFEPFHRSARGRQHDGNGLGLSIVRACLQAHDGRVSASNLPPPVNGFLVRMELPLAP